LEYESENEVHYSTNTSLSEQWYTPGHDKRICLPVIEVIYFHLIVLCFGFIWGKGNSILYLV
jgi:hypothetical protein